MKPPRLPVASNSSSSSRRSARRCRHGVVVAGRGAQAVLEELLARDLGVARRSLVRAADTKPTGEALVATICVVQFAQREARRQGREVEAGVVRQIRPDGLARHRGRAAARGARLASASVSPTISLASQRCRPSRVAPFGDQRRRPARSRCFAIMPSLRPAPNTWSAKCAEARMPRGEPPAWISTGRPAATARTLSGPSP